MPTYAYINPRMLAWARRRAGFSTTALAQKVKPVLRERLDAWERPGSPERPTFKQAQHLADVLHVPFGYLFLLDAPSEELPLPDLRTKRDPSNMKPSPDFLEVVYDAMRKQEWYHDHLREQDSDPLLFVGKYTPATPVDEIAANIRQTLGINDELRREARDNDDYFRLLVARCEGAGVLVIRTSIVGNNTRRALDPEEFQGFARADLLAPLVFINQNDYLSAQIFTLMHEVAHLWIGVSGVSDPDYLEPPPDTNGSTHQQLADQIAAETLVPAAEFSQRWDRDRDAAGRLERLRRHYKVSAFVLLRRAYDLGRLSSSEYRSEYDLLRSQIKPKKGGGGGGYSTMLSRNSRTVATAVLRSVLEGRLPPTEGATLLNVRPPTLYNMAADI